MVGRGGEIVISPLFSPEEASVLIMWLDLPRTSGPPAELIGRLKDLVELWAIDPKMVIV